ncbi:MAG TPA: sigma-70 family RNA polymerase sigma factor [Gaiella sp.]|jgi:RNA polymerase sigma factor (sigma-70 family)|nr:sigma-70 family RNA polymerase sigma factor [Gaiella sp.]
MIEDTLVEQALHLPRREARRWAHTPLEQEDLVADGNLALAKAAKRYDPSYGVPFPAFATPYVRGAIADTVRSRARRNTLGDGRWVDVVGFAALTPSVRSEQAYEPPDPGPTPHDTVENLDRLRVLGTIPERERIALIRTMVDGDTVADVAKDLGVSTDRVYTLVHNGSTRVRRRAA